MYLYLIRHGQSTNNLLYETTGVDTEREFDPLLTEKGCRQADALATYLQRQAESAGAEALIADEEPAALQMRLTHLYTSLMQRTILTALPTARALGLPLTGWKDLHEGGGLYLHNPETDENEGKPGPDRAWMAQTFPELGWPPDLDDGPWWNRPFEERAERMPRARRVLDELLVRHGGSDDRVAFFTHAAFSNYFLSTLVGLEQDRSQVWFSMYNCAITGIKFVPDEAALIFLNRLHHLPDELVTR